MRSVFYKPRSLEDAEQIICDFLKNNFDVFSGTQNRIIGPGSKEYWNDFKYLKFDIYEDGEVTELEGSNEVYSYAIEVYTASHFLAIRKGTSINLEIL